MKPRQQKNALSLLELVIAIAVFTVGLLGVASLIHSTHLTHLVFKERAAAASAAQEKLEEVAAFPTFNDLVANFDQAGFDVMVGPQRTGLDDGSGQHLLTQATDTTLFPATRPGGATQAGYLEVEVLRADLVEVRATVAWRSATNGEEKLVYLLRIARED
ncbi:MAG: hypothetical protein JKY65_32715 [Planctomycetes bacterium]|nr:hypothetical protein [Planctomycetota bacterium]